MANKKQKHKVNPILIAGITVALVVTATIFGYNSIHNKVSDTNKDTNTTATGTSASEEQAVKVTANADGNLVILTADITESATFFQYDSNGTMMEFRRLTLNNKVIHSNV